ncbi:hypothetical protein [Mycobacterium neglectum]|uniref:hypothetical protein n=1 Tax=Mycobacterium neglectum TaxID=242737 RepID=UPI001FEAB00B|nr:hypothetical protein [Mycobacterium neglectum]
MIVTRRDPKSGTYRALGFLDRVADGYEFAYLLSATADPSFVPIVGFSESGRRYFRQQLFPSFAERVIGAKRPDRPRYLASLNLEQTADSWEILSASGGYREGDPIELIALPSFDPVSGRTSASFLAHGVRHRPETASEHISALTPGADIGLKLDPDNDFNPKAIQIVDGEVHLGFVPDPLVDYVGAVMTHGGTKVTVLQANPPETNPHLRLLLRLEGTVRPFPFDGPEWRAAA